MTYSRPTTGQVDAFGEIGTPMAITRQGGRSRSEVSRNGRYLDNRSPEQVGANAKAKTAGITNFVDFLVKDIAPVVKSELQVQGKAQAMEAINSIPGMADGSFYRQSDVEQQKVLKDYTLSGYALDQFKSYGAGVAVGQYQQEMTDRMLASPILASDAPQAERDAERKRIINDSRSVLRGIEPGYLAKYAPSLSQLEGKVTGQVESSARDARNANALNTAVSQSSTMWTQTAGGLLAYGELSPEERAAEFTKGPVAALKQDWLQARSTMTAREWYKKEERGWKAAISQAIGDGDVENAQALMAAWELAVSSPIYLENGTDVWANRNNASEGGKTNAETVAQFKRVIDRLEETRSEDIVLRANAEDIALALGGDPQARARLEARVVELFKDEKIDQATALNEALTRELGNQERRFQENIPELGRLASLRRDPRVSNEEYLQEVQTAVRSQLISPSKGASLATSLYAPSEKEKAADEAYEYQEEKALGTLLRDRDTGETKFQEGENENVNNAIADARKSEPGIENYLNGSFMGEVEVAVKEQFKEGEPIPTGEELRNIIETESIKLLKRETARIKAQATKTAKGKAERASNVRQPIYDAIDQGLQGKEIWGEDINNYARGSRDSPERVWSARYAASLVGLPNPDGEKGELYTEKTARDEAKDELVRIRKRLRGAQQQSNKQNPGNRFAPTPVPTAVEISYDTAMPGFQEEIVKASTNPDQEGQGGVLAVGGTAVLNALGRVLPGGGSPAAAAETQNKELAKAKSLQAIENSNGWKTLNRMFARRQRVSATTEPLPQLPPTALTDTVAIAMTSDRHPFFVHIGVAEGTRTINGGYTRAYRGHTDPGDGNWNRGTVSGGRGTSATPKQVDAQWMRTLTSRSARLAPVVAQAGLRPGTVGYNRFMFNYLDLSVQSPKAADDFAGKLSMMKAGNWSIEIMAKARADSFFVPGTNRLDAPGFNNSYSRLLGDQRSRAGVWDYKRRI